jgi:hypothetical protein
MIYNNEEINAMLRFAQQGRFDDMQIAARGALSLNSGQCHKCGAQGWNGRSAGLSPGDKGFYSGYDSLRDTCKECGFNFRVLLDS